MMIVWRHGGGGEIDVAQMWTAKCTGGGIKTNGISTAAAGAGTAPDGRRQVLRDS